MLNGKVAIVTGGAGDIGREICIELAKEGASIAIHYNNSYEQAVKLREYIKSNFSYAEIFKADISDRQQVDNMIDSIYNKFGRIDYLINNAGIAQIKPFIEITEEDWDRMMNVNLKGLFNCTQSVLRHMLPQKHGSIINISSIWGISGASCEVHYSASKGGIIAFTKALAKELGPSKIRVNCIAPGVIDTRMNNILNREEKKHLIEDIPLMSIGKPQDVANAVLFLLSDKANFITGQVITVDGGFI
ncbi:MULTISPECIES: elongation factor P 5-aminopentanone reductase [Thermoanaerobacter]|uniref:Short-chain dehydrogenase/reductase SDR n=2 Tax=Thermoanaerobacter TaxID=1754 RepID=G2MUQ5_9THEO|nr:MULTISPECIES: SDR family oxidoreductase [Thermoanaerobacter]EGD52016.1 short-chain dehydrogenase/reductase SDR [Thermoanaerobacter ethanolicus JW 200]HHY79076.1 SDR family oxidoreductase [Thermoanaerobacter sp.]AEM77578.1 short-chain dehydrogenase/reductase SDR [Thermoanaerobacter wiegelii Rt8.B1]AIS51271.1 3-oxoacyl-[acyl-carrier-protein] reductase FabG [Thermoanaerobacter kivui]UZQ83073.1 SDR family oxidoreductase [Thermoanaerobacter sp. RKWS2]